MLNDALTNPDLISQRSISLRKSVLGGVTGIANKLGSYAHLKVSHNSSSLLLTCLYSAAPRPPSVADNPSRKTYSMKVDVERSYHLESS